MQDGDGIYHDYEKSLQKKIVNEIATSFFLCWGQVDAKYPSVL